MSKIRCDKNGQPYVITNGAVYRPQAGPYESPVPKRNWGKGIESKFAIGADVQIKNINQSTFCKLRTADGLEEIWTVHGYDIKNPETCLFDQSQAKSPTAEPIWLPHQLITGEQLVQQLNRPRG